VQARKAADEKFEKRADWNWKLNDVQWIGEAIYCDADDDDDSSFWVATKMQFAVVVMQCRASTFSPSKPSFPGVREHYQHLQGQATAHTQNLAWGAIKLWHLW